MRTKQADKAISSIKPGHIQEVKKLPNPADVIKMVFDCILLLFHLPVRFSHPHTGHDGRSFSLCGSGLVLLCFRLSVVPLAYPGAW